VHLRGGLQDHCLLRRMRVTVCKMVMVVMI
jgi:hypothetical protein